MKPQPPHLCPLCGQLNGCAANPNDSAATLACWCQSQPISPQALGRLHPEALNTACLCPRCAAGLPPESMGAMPSPRQTPD